MQPERLFEENLELIDRILRSIAVRNGMYGDDAEEYASWARLRLIDNDYAMLAKFQGRAKLSTYLNTVLHNLFRDYRIHKWGKWRPSAAARRLGTDAVLLETLVVRDGHEVEMAFRIMRENAGIDRTDLELEGLFRRLPPRETRREVGGEILDSLGYEDGTESRVRDAEKGSLADAASRALGDGMAAMDPEDRLILRLRFEEGWTLARVARSLGLEQKPLYRRVNDVLAGLRERLEGAGVAVDEMQRLIGWPGLDLALDYGPEGNGVESETSDVVRLNPEAEV